jgi:hypothetical protein
MVNGALDLTKKRMNTRAFLALTGDAADNFKNVATASATLVQKNSHARFSRRLSNFRSSGSYMASRLVAESLETIARREHAQLF